jgi:TonB-linked SusC/RagA family outer membrane protein
MKNKYITKIFFCISFFLLFTGQQLLNAAPASVYEDNLQQRNDKIQLKGTVVDEQRLPLVGVTVTLVGTENRTATDMDGHFSLYVNEGTSDIVLRFSYIGMVTQDYKVTNPSSAIKVRMKETVESLDEVVITGMEVIKKDRMTGSASVLTAKDLRMQGVTTIDRILDGQIAGLNSTTLSGAPGTRSQITIRGENNLSGNTEPLWIIDGLPMTSGVPTNSTGDYAGTIMQDGVGNIMPDDIESISILKDASAAAIYGARAANGAIVITTKKGFRSKTQVNYSGTYSISTSPSNNLEFMNSEEKLKYEKSIVDNYGLNYAYLTGRGGYTYKRAVDGFITPTEYEQEISRLSKINTNWFDVLFRTAQSQSHSVSLRGGSEELTYYTSINYQNQQGILRSNEYSNAGLLMNLDYRPVKNLIVSLNVSANARKNRDNASIIDPFTYAMFANPYEQPYDEDGNYAADLSYLSNNYTTERASGYAYENFNILKELNETRETIDGSDVELTLNVAYNILPNLKIQSIFRRGASYNTTTTEVNAGTYTSYASEVFANRAYQYYDLLPDGYDNGQLSEASGKNRSWAIRNQLDYSLTLKNDHLITLLLANEVMSKKYTNFGYTSPIYYSDYRITGVPTFDNGVSYDTMYSAIASMFNTSDGQDRSVSFLGSLRYGYKDKYIVNFNYRADGADVIGDSNRFTPLWSVGLRYNLHKESFFKNDIINELALRASYGYTGNIDRTAYPFSTITYGSNSYQGDRYATSFTYPNPTVKWEKKRDRNVGVDMSLFDNLIHMTFDYYSNRTDDVLETLSVPYSTGRTTVKANGGIVSNKGFEFYTNVRWVNTKDLTFSTSVNLARNKNVINKSHYNYESYQEVIKSSVSKGGVINIIGKETGSVYGWKYAGVNPKTGNPQYYLTDDAKRAYGKFLDGWDSLSETKKSLYQIYYDAAVDGIPDVVDFVRGESTLPDFFRPSMQYLGTTNPKLTGGCSSYLRYKNFEFTTNWTFKVGHLVPNFNDYQNAPRNGVASARAALGYSSDMAVSSTNREKKYLYYWQFPGDVTNVSKFATSDDDIWCSIVTSENYSKGDYMRMTNLSLSYRFPQKLIRNWGGMNNLTIGLNARNLITFTKYKGLDVGSGSAFSYPVAREYNIKLSVGF